MNPWYVSLGVALIVTPVVLFLLHRVLLRWEERGHIYYWHKKPQSGAISSLGALQQAVEPGYQHVAQIREQIRDDVTQRDLVLARLLSCLQAEVVDQEAIRELLNDYDGDRAELYAEAVRLAGRP